VANVLIELDQTDADLARAESYGVAYLPHNDETEAEWLDLFAGGYLDRIERRAGVWRIADRVVVHHWSASTRLDDSSFPLDMSGFTQGRRDAQDPVYLI
jgi:hypothetical protein